MSYNEALHGESALGFDKFETVRIPDLFISFIAQPVPVNPLYEQAFAESMIWFSNIGVTELGDESIYQYLRDINVALWGAMAVPKAGYETLRTYIDWLNWVFVFDDKFDTGSMDNDQISAKELLESLLANMKGQKWTKEKHPWVKAHDAIWARVKARAPERVSRRYLQMTERYCHGVWDQIQANTKNQLSTVEERVIRSRGSSATMQTFNLVAYAYGIDLPDEIYKSPEFTRFRELSSDIIVLATDVVSYMKEQTEGVNNNVISIARMQGMSAQAAHDYIGELIKEKYREWHLARAAIPIMGEAMDFEVESYIQGIVNCSLASTHSVAAEVRKTRLISVYPEEYYIQRRREFSGAAEIQNAEEATQDQGSEKSDDVDNDGTFAVREEEFMAQKRAEDVILAAEGKLDFIKHADGEGAIAVTEVSVVAHDGDVNPLPACEEKQDFVENGDKVGVEIVSDEVQNKDPKVGESEEENKMGHIRHDSLLAGNLECLF